MKTTQEQRVAIVQRVNACFAVDNLIPNSETKSLQEVYISGRFTISEIIEQAKKDLEKRLADRKLSSPLNDNSPISQPITVVHKPIKSAKKGSSKTKTPNHAMSR